MTLHYARIPPRPPVIGPQPPQGPIIEASRLPGPVLGMIVDRGKNIPTEQSTFNYLNFYQYEWVKVRFENGYFIPECPGSLRYDLGESDSYIILNPAVELNNRHVPKGTVVRLYPSAIHYPRVFRKTERGEELVELPPDVDFGIIYLFDAAQILVRVMFTEDLIPNELGEGTDNLINKHKVKANLVDDPYGRNMEVVELLDRDHYYDLKYDNENSKNKYFLNRGIIRQNTIAYAQPQPDVWTDTDHETLPNLPAYEWLLVDTPVVEQFAYAQVSDFIAINGTGKAQLICNERASTGSDLVYLNKYIKIHNRGFHARPLVKNEIIQIRWDPVGKVWQPIVETPIRLELAETLYRGGSATAKIVYRDLQDGVYKAANEPLVGVVDAMRVVRIGHAGMRCHALRRQPPRQGDGNLTLIIESIEPVCLTVLGQATTAFDDQDENVTLDNIVNTDGGFLKEAWQAEITAHNIFQLSGYAGTWCEARFDIQNLRWYLSSTVAQAASNNQSRKLYLASISGASQVYIHELELTVYVNNPCNLPMTIGDYCLVARVDGMTYEWTVVTVIPQYMIGLYGENHQYRKTITFNASDFAIVNDGIGGYDIRTAGVTKQDVPYDRVFTRRGLVTGGFE